jgi:hypothetical protein
MTDIDYALARDFIDPDDGAPRQLRFRRNWAPKNDPRVYDGAGQLVAVVANGGRSDNGDTIAISRADVRFDDVEAALDGWQTWAMITSTTVNLAEIRRRIHTGGLD